MKKNVKQISLKHKKILIGGIVAAASIGTLTAILIPILNKESQTNNKKLSNYESLVAKIVGAENEQVAKERTMELYGLEVKNDDDIALLEDDKRIPYDVAVVLGKYIFSNKDKYQISVYEGEDNNSFEQLLLVFKLKTNEVASQVDDSLDWPINKIDTSQDEFAFLNTIFQNKFVHGKFENGKLESAPQNFASGFKTKKYKMLELFFAFKKANPSENDFSKYNSASDDDKYASEVIREYIISLGENDLAVADLVDSIKFTKDDLNPINGKVPGTITFNYEDYKETKNVKFIYTNEYKLEIVSTKETKMADEVIATDVQFVDGETPHGVSIASVEVSTKSPDGSKVLVTFQVAAGTKPLTPTQELGGFSSYKQKAFEIIKTMTNGDFIGIAPPETLASVYESKNVILDLIKTKIDGLVAINAGILAKVKDSITTDDIILTSNDVTGSLDITIENLDDMTFTVSGFLTKDQKDVNDVVTLFKQSIGGVGPLKGFGAVDEDKTPLTSATSTLENKENILPKSLDGPKTANELGFKSPSLPEGVLVTYLVAGNNSDGTITVTATILKNSVTKKVKFKLLGYQTTTERNISIVDNVVSFFKQNILGHGPLKGFGAVNEDETPSSSTTTTLEDKENVLPKSLDGPKTADELGIKSPSLPEGVLVTYLVAGNNNDGTMIVTATISKDVITKKVKFKLSGFLTNDQKAINEVKNLIDALKDTAKTSRIAIVAIEESRNIEFSALIFESLGGNKSSFPADIKATTLTYSHSGRDRDGDLTVTVKINKGSGTEATTTFTVAVSGIDQKNVDDVATWFKSTSANRLQAKVNKDDAIETRVSKSMVAPGDAVTTNLTSLGVTDTSGLPTSNGVTITYEIASDGVDSTTGTVIIKATISKGGITSTVYFKLSGYQTTTQKEAQVDVDVVAAWFTSTSANRLQAKAIKTSINFTTKASGKLMTAPGRADTSSLTNLGVNTTGLSIPDGVAIAYAIVSSDVDNAVGTVIIRATISKAPASSKVVYFKLGGFQTTARKAQADVTRVANLFKSGGLKAGDSFDGLTATPTSLALASSTTLPSSLNDGTTKGTIGFIEPDISSVDGVAYSVHSHSNDDGTLIVKAIISKAGVSKTIYFELNNYQTTTQKNALTDVTEFANKFKEAGAGKLKAADSPNTLTATATVYGAATTTLPSYLSRVRSIGEILLTFTEPSSKPVGVDVFYSVHSHSDATGTLIVEAVISKSGTSSQTVYFKLGGFQTTADEAQAAITRVADLFKLGDLKAGDSFVGLTATPTNYGAATTTLPSYLSYVRSTGEILLTFTEPIIVGVDHVVYSVHSHSDATGTLIIKATIEKAPASSKVVYFKLGGFQTTTRKAQADVDEVATWFKGTSSNELQAKVMKTSIDFTTQASGKSEVTPSSANTNSLSDLGVANTAGLSIPDGVTIAYEIASSGVDVAVGTVIIKATISKTPVSQVVYFKLGGYQTTVQKEALDAVTRVANLFKLGDLKAKGFSGLSSLTATATNYWATTTTLPSYLSHVRSIDEILLTFTEPIIVGVDSVVYSVQSHSNADGTLIIKATIEKEGATSKVVYFKLGGFQTTANEAQAVITKVANLFKLGDLKAGDFFNGLTATSTSLALASSTTLPSSLNDETTKGTIGFIEPDISSVDGVGVTYSIQSHSNAAGTLIVKAIISKAGVSKTIYFELNNYQTTTQKNALTDITEFANKFKEAGAGKLKAADSSETLTATATDYGAATTTLPSYLSSERSIGEIQFTFIEPSSKPDGVSVVYSVHSHSDGAGTLIIKATISKAPASPKVVYFKLGGFQTTADEAQAAVTRVADLFKLGDLKAWDSFDGLTATLTSLALASSTTLPSSLNDETTKGTIGFIEPDISSVDGVGVTYSIQSHHNAAGTLIVKAIISKAGVSKTIYFELNNYQTTAEKEALDAVTKVANLFKLGVLKAKGFSGLSSLTATATDLPRATTTLPSSLSEENEKGAIGFTEPAIAGVNGVVYSVHSHSDADGTLIVKAIISKTNTSSQIVYFELNGYKTTIGKSDLTDVTEFTNKFKETALGKLSAKDSDVSLTATTTNLPGATTTLPSDVLSKSSPSEIGFIEPSSKPSGVSVVYSVHSRSDAAGTLIVKAIISKKSGTSQTVYFKLRGLQTIAQRSAQVAITRAANLFKSDSLKAGDAPYGLTATSTSLLSAVITLPSQLLSANLPSTLGFIEPDKLGVDSVVYSIKSHSDTDGTLVVEAIISKSGTSSQTVYFKLRGFQTIAQGSVKSDLKAVNDVVGSIKTSGAFGFYNLSPFLVVENFEGIYTNEKFGVNIDQKDTKIFYGFPRIGWFGSPNLHMQFKVQKGGKVIAFTKAVGLNDDWKYIRDIMERIRIASSVSKSSKVVVADDEIALVNDYAGILTSGKFGIIVNNLNGVVINYQHIAVARSATSLEISFKVSKNGKSGFFTFNFAISQT